MAVMYIPYQPAFDPLGSAVGQGIGQGIEERIRQQKLKKDQEALRKWIDAQQQPSLAQAATMGDQWANSIDPSLSIPAPGVNPDPRMSMPLPPGNPDPYMSMSPYGGRVPMPTFRTPEYQQAAAGLQLNQLDPMYGANLEYTRARTGLAQAQTEAVGQPTPQYQQTTLPENNPYGQPEGTLMQRSPEGKIEFISPPTQNATEQISQMELDRLKGMPKELQSKILEQRLSGARELDPQFALWAKKKGGIDNLTADDIEEYRRTAAASVNVDMRPMTESMVTGKANKEALLAIGQDILAKWNPSWTGPIQGRWTEFKNKWIGGNKGRAAFEAAVTSMLEQMYQRAGKQLSDTEIKTWEPFRPQITNPDTTFEGRMENMMNNVATYLDWWQKTAKSGGYETGETSASAWLKQNGINPATPQNHTARNATKLNIPLADPLLKSGLIDQTDYDNLQRAWQDPANRPEIVRRLNAIKGQSQISGQMNDLNQILMGQVKRGLMTPAQRLKALEQAKSDPGFAQRYIEQWMGK